MAKTSHQFPTLDAIRGLAAIDIVLFHIHFHSRQGLAVAQGRLAVDFFFMLSGFVLTLAYQKRLEAGWSTGAFLRMRVIRLYPLYALGLGLGVLAAWRLGALGPIPAHVWWTRLSLAIFVLPALPGMAGGTQVFMFNNPSWSLCMELLANLFHAVFLRRRLRNVVLAMIVFGLLLVRVLMRSKSLYVGMDTPTFFYGIPRALFLYCFGMLLFRRWERGDLRPKAPPLLICLTLLAVLAAPSLPTMQGYFDAIVLFLVFPWMLLAGASSDLPKRYLKVANFLGLTSYAVYILHEPLLLFWAPLMHRLGWTAATMGAAWGIPCVVIVFLVAWLADRFYDGPVRAWLQRTLVTRKA